MKKTVLFVPGFKENINSRDYRTVLRAIEKRGYNVQFIDINWKRTTAEDWTKQLEAEYEKHDRKSTILAGFSFGALTTFITSAKRLPLELWLFSLSPFFAEDLPYIKEWELKYLGVNRVAAAKETSFDELAALVTCPVKLFVGSRELAMWPEMSRRHKDAIDRLGNATLVVVDNVGHCVDSKAYVDAIKESI